VRPKCVQYQYLHVILVRFEELLVGVLDKELKILFSLLVDDDLHSQLVRVVGEVLVVKGKVPSTDRSAISSCTGPSYPSTPSTTPLAVNL
jgi:hypothetical protein